MIWLALDVGRKRIGLARTDELGWVHPAGVIERKGGTTDLERIRGEMEKHGAGGLVVGLPLNMDGTEGDAARSARRLADRLREYIECPVELWDERLTSFEAEQILQEAGYDSKKRRRLVDQMAAVLILKDFLEHRRQREQA